MSDEYWVGKMLNVYVGQIAEAAEELAALVHTLEEYDCTRKVLDAMRAELEEYGERIRQYLVTIECRIDRQEAERNDRTIIEFDAYRRARG